MSTGRLHKVNILFLASTDPRETSYGGQQRTHVLWKGLKSIGVTYTIVLVPHKFQEDYDDVDKIYRVCLERRHSLGWFAQRLLKRFIPYWDTPIAYDQRKFREFIETRIGEVDIVVSRFIQPAAALRLWLIAPLFVDADDIHTFEFDAQTQLLGNGLLRRLKRRLLGRFQFAVYAEAKKIWVPAQEHVGLLPDYPMAWLPNIPCPPLPDVSDNLVERKHLMFVGLMASNPNYLALDAFFKNYWSDLKKIYPDLEFDVIGGGLPSLYADSWNQYAGVNLHGFVADLRPFYEKSFAVVTPMLIGMGTCIKVLEALRMGRPVISTDQGLRGIANERRTPANGIHVFSDLNTLVSAIAMLRRFSSGEYRDMAKNAMRFIEEFYSQQAVNEILAKDLLS